MMKAFALRSQFHFPTHTPLSKPPASAPRFPPLIPTSSNPNTPPPSPTQPQPNPHQSLASTNPRVPLPIAKPNPNASSNSKSLVTGAVSIGLALLILGMDDAHGSRALALGPEGPLMEEFWENVRRYALYALTVSTGVAYAVIQPIYELLKNPISAVLVIVIMVGTFYLMSQVLSAMVGVTDFAYEYSY